MKLIRFSRADERPSFGVVVADRAGPSQCCKSAAASCHPH